MEWKNFFRGLLMGTVDLVPGVSSGTIAVLIGIYDKLIAAINGFFSREWKKNLLYLLPIVIGMAVALFSFSRVMDYLIEFHHRATFYFFIGLVIGIIPLLIRQSRAKASFKMRHIIIVIVTIIVMGLVPVDEKQVAIITDRSLQTYLLFFVSGFIASAAMILPGISGSFMLVVIGVYPTVIRAVSEIDIVVILVVGIGIFFGIVTMSKLIHNFIIHYRTTAFAFIIGLVTGSISIIFRQAGMVESASELMLCIIVLLLGMFLAYILGKIES